MRIAVASGKGGTGKTTVAVGLSEAISEIGWARGGDPARGAAGAALGGQLPHPPVRILDCDVEEPNAHLFLGAEETDRRDFSVKMPRIDERKCTNCGKCADFCEFNALMQIGKKMMVFDNLCHGCGGCSILCPEGAIREVDRPIGKIVVGQVSPGSVETNGDGSATNGPIETVYGLLNVGEALVPPLIRAVKRDGGDFRLEKFKLRGDEGGRAGAAGAPAADGEAPAGDIIVDSPPGTSCPMVTAVKDADFSLLVTENTPFGLHDLELAVETLAEMDIPMGVVINRADVGHADVREYCRRQGIPVLLTIPYDEEVAVGYAKGRSIVSSAPRYREEFRRLYRRIEEIVEERRAV